MGTRTDSGDTEAPVKCSVCHRGIRVDCEWRQGRCPHREPMFTIPLWRVAIYIFIAPFIITAWCIMNPHKVWNQMKEDWNL